MKLKKGDIVEVHGWVMLEKLEAGKYRVKATGTQSGIDYYDFAKPRGSKTIVRHAITNVDPWVRDASNPDLNKIVLLTSGAACPTSE